jgi:hypothetical protein
MSQLQSLLESANQHKIVQNDAERLARKWAKTGLLEGLASEADKNNMAMILENQAKQLLNETSQTGGTATFTAGTGEQWAGVALPLVRKVFGQISSKEFVSVQPMNLPSGLVFYLDFQYGGSGGANKSPFNIGDSMYGDQGGNTPFGNTNTGGLYGAGRFGYSINNTSSVTAINATASANWFTDFNADGAYTSSFTSYSVYSIPTSSLGDNYDAKAIRGFYISGSGLATITSADILPAFTKIDGGNLEFVALSGLGSGSAAHVATVFFTLQPVDNKRGDFEQGNTDLNSNNTTISIPEINVKLQSSAIVAKTRKLKAVWTPEFAQDLNAYHALDAEAELTSVMSEYIALEIDLEILDMLIDSAAAGTEYWTAENNRALNGTQYTNNNLGFYNSQGQWFQTLGTKMQKLSNIIHQKTLRGGANFMILSPSVATVLESIPGFASTSDGDAAKSKYAFGVQKSGQLNNRYDVYKNPYMTENVILMGYRGGQFLEAGAVFAPYIPLIMTPLVYDPDTFVPRKGLLTRYAKKMVRPEFYGKIYVSGLNTI